MYPCRLPITFAPSTQYSRYTAEGFEETIGVNHLAHFYIAEKLLGKGSGAS